MRPGIGSYSEQRASEVEAGAPVDSLRGHRVDVTLTQDHVLLALDLDLEPVLRVEEDLVPDLDRADVRTHGPRLGPRQAPGYLRRGRNQDAGLRSTLAVGLADLDQDPIGQ